MIYIFFDKNSLGNGVKSEITLNQELAEELHKSFTRKFEKRKDYSSFKERQYFGYWSCRYLIYLCVIDNYSKYASFGPWKDKKGITITNAFWEILNQSWPKPNKIWVYKGS